MAAFQEDANCVPMANYPIPIKWVPAEKHEQRYYYPNGLLEVIGCDIGNHRIARYKNRDNFWYVRPSKMNEETFSADLLDGFLAVRYDLISWKPVENDRYPKDKYFISGKSADEPQKCIGKHKTFGVGYVTRDLSTDKLTFYQEGEPLAVTGIEVLCINWPNNN